jgi:GDP-L-fucose synthase
MQHDSRILITGSAGMVGKALCRQLTAQGYNNLFTPPRKELDLTAQSSVNTYFAAHKPEYVFHLAAVVGGIHANNTRPAEFCYANTMMQSNVIIACHQTAVRKVLFPGSACTYPKLAEQPMQESAFLTGPVEPTNLAYAAAKINGLVLCQSYAKQHGLKAILPMPTNAYGVGDNFDPLGSHVIPALMQRFVTAKKENLPEVTLWGTGTPLREFIYVDDLADALIFLMQHYESSELINVATQEEISMQALAQLIADTVAYKGKIVNDATKPDGAPRKCLNGDKLFALGWRPRVTLEQGLKRMYQHHFEGAPC